MTGSKNLRIFSKKVHNEVCSEVADVVSANTTLNEADFFNMAAPSDLLIAKILEDGVEICVQRSCKGHVESMSSVPRFTEPEPKLLHFWEYIPCLQQAFVYCAGCSLISKKPEVIDNPVMQFLVLLRFTSEQQKWINEEWQIID